MTMLHAGHDHPGPLLGGILGHCATFTQPKVQPAALQCSLATAKLPRNLQKICNSQTTGPGGGIGTMGRYRGWEVDSGSE
jgi:hypothetical protein